MSAAGEGLQRHVLSGFVLPTGSPPWASSRSRAAIEARLATRTSAVASELRRGPGPVSTPAKTISMIKVGFNDIRR